MTILELAYQTGIKPKWVASTEGGEYHSSCPDCGGTDRFRIQPNRQMSKCKGWYTCRCCGNAGDAIKFAQQFLNYTFQEAIDVLNVDISAFSTPFLINQFYSPKLTTLRAPSALWTEQATAFTEYAHKNILNNKEVERYLRARGLTRDAITKYKLGWLNDTKLFSRTSWGLSEETNQNGRPNIWIPKGLVIPSMERGVTQRLKIRRADWKDSDKLPKYIAISGGMNGLTIIGSTKMDTVIVVESELDGYAVHNAVEDLACVIAVGSNIKNPDNITDRIAKNASHLLICHDNDAAGKKMLDKWCTFYSHAKAHPTPIGKDIGEAVKLGMNIREWLIKKIS